MMDATETGEGNIILVTTPSTRMTVEGTKKLQCEVFSVPLDSVSESPIKINFLLTFPQEFGFNSFRLVLLLEISLPMKILRCEDMRSFLLCDRTHMAGKQITWSKQITHKALTWNSQEVTHPEYVTPPAQDTITTQVTRSRYHRTRFAPRPTNRGRVSR